MPERPRGYEIAVLGAGCAGAAVAYALARRRIAPVVIDIAGPGAVVPVSATAPVERGAPADIALALRGAERLPELQDAVGEFGYRRTGGMTVALTDAEEAMGRARASEAAAAGLPVRWLSREETLRREPAVTDRAAGAVYCAADGVADPGGLARRLLATSTRFGGAAHLDCGYVSILRQTGGFRIRAGRDEVVARRIVLASAEVLRVVARQLGLAAQIRAARRRICVTDRLLPMLRHTINGIRQEPGGELVLDPPAAVDDGAAPDDVRGWVEALRRIAAAAVRVIPGIDRVRVVHAPAMVSAEPADGRPAVGLAEENVYLAIPSAAQAVTQCPVIGEAIADAVTRNRRPDGLEIWSVDRFVPADRLTPDSPAALTS